MSRPFAGKAVVVSGAARGQGRSHAIRFAEQGADVIAFDICAQLDSVAYPMASRADLDHTVELVEKVGGRIVADVADVRHPEDVNAVLARGVERFGPVDVVVANAGISVRPGPSGSRIRRTSSTSSRPTCSECGTPFGQPCR